MKIAGILAVATAVVAALGCGGDDPAPLADTRATADSVASEGAAGARAGVTPTQGITVIGTASATTVPDVVEWSFGVHSRADTAEEALRENSAAMDRLLAALRRAGVAGDDLQTQHVSLWPDMGEEGATVVGYTASNSVRATIREMAKAGAVVDAAAAGGANEIYGPNFSVGDTRAQFAKAAAAAYDDARRKAEALAAKAGLSLGPPIAIAEAAGGPVYAEALAAEAGAADVPIEPGKQEQQVTLTVTFAVS